MFIGIFLSACKTVDLKTDKELENSEIIASENEISIDNFNDESEYIIKLVESYISQDYKDLKDELLQNIQKIALSKNLDYENIVLLVKNSDNARELSSLISKLDTKSIADYYKFLIKSKTEFKLELLEFAGSIFLNMGIIEENYAVAEKSERLAILYSSGFLNSSSIINWIADKLKEKDEEIITASIVALSKQGNPGLLVLSNNIGVLPQRLRISTVDLLIYNKIDNVYGNLPSLLVDSNSVLTDRIIKLFSELGKRGLPYVYTALKISPVPVKTRLLEILELYEDKPYITKIDYLLDIPQLQENLIHKIFHHNDIYSLRNIFLRNNLDIITMTVKYGFEINSKLLFQDSRVRNVVLENCIKIFKQEEVQKYFNYIGLDNVYYLEYLEIVELYQRLDFIIKFESENGESDFVTRYFELEQRRIIEDKESTLFFEGMTKWLENGDITHLEQSKNIKKAEELNELSIDREFNDYLNSLSFEQQQVIELYKKYKGEISSKYKTLTYRLKDFCRYLFQERGYLVLLE